MFIDLLLGFFKSCNKTLFTAEWGLNSFVIAISVYTLSAHSFDGKSMRYIPSLRNNSGACCSDKNERQEGGELHCKVCFSEVDFGF